MPWAMDTLAFCGRRVENRLPDRAPRPATASRSDAAAGARTAQQIRVTSVVRLGVDSDREMGPTDWRGKRDDLILSYREP